MRKYFSLLVLLALVLGAPAPLDAEESDTEELSEYVSEYVDVFEGDMPLLFAVGHGGWKQVGDLKVGWSGPDPLLRDYFFSILAPRIYEKTGHLPYIVYQQGDRDYVNTNRAVGHSEAYHTNNPSARAAYMAFHDAVDTLIARVEAQYGDDMAVLINPHTTDLSAGRGGRPWDRISDIGFIASVTNLNSSANTMQALYDRKGEIALRGEDSIPYQWFHGQDWPSPDAVWPAAATSNAKSLAQTGDDVWHVLPAWVSGYNANDWTTAYFNGAYTVIYHGTNTWGRHANWSRGLDGFQMEVNYTKSSGIALDQSGAFQLDVPFTTALMDDLIDAILYSLQVNYNWTPGDAYNVLVDNGDDGFSTSGTWNESKGQGYWGTTSIFANQVGPTATWTPDLAEAGWYAVWVRWTKAGTRTDRAQYTVNHANGSLTLTRDQGSDWDAKWVLLGFFEFEAGTAGNVVLTSIDTLSTAADAVLFRRVDQVDHVHLPTVQR